MNSKTKYEIDTIIIDLDKLISNSDDMKLLIFLSKEKIMHFSIAEYTIAIPYIKDTKFVFDDDFLEYQNNQYELDMLLLLGYVKSMSKECNKHIESCVSMNFFINMQEAQNK